MIYVIGHTRREYLVDDILFPKAAYSDEELARGRKSVLALDESRWDLLKQNPLVKELLAEGAIEALDEAPADKFALNADLQEALRTSEEARKLLVEENARLKKEYEALHKESIETIQMLQNKIVELGGEV